MKHARSDYDHIQDLTGKIPDDEPVMMFRGQDIFAPVALEAYVAMCEAMASTMPLDSPARQNLRDMAVTVRVHINRMHRWQVEHKAKMPDLSVRKPVPSHLTAFIAPGPDLRRPRLLL